MSIIKYPLLYSLLCMLSKFGKDLKDVIGILKKLFQPLKKDKTLVIRSIVNTIIISFIGAYSVKLTSQFIAAIEQNMWGDFDIILTVFVTVLIVMYVLGYINQIVSGYFSTRLTANLDTKYMREFLLMDNNTVEHLGTGKANNIVKRGVAGWINIIGSMISAGIASLITIVTAFILIGMYNQRWVNILVFLGLIFFAIIWFYGYKKISVFRKIRRDIYTKWDRSFIKVFMTKFEILQDHKINTEIEHYKSYVPKVKKSILDGANTRLFYIDTSRMLIDGVRLNILFFGGLLVLSGQLTIAILILYIYLLGLVVAALSSINSLTSTITENFIYVEKLWDVFDKAPKIKNYTHGPEFIYKKGNIFIDKLHYQYDQDVIFDNFSLTIPQGKTTALVGMSGCGKTTLAKMISGYLTPQKGYILVDGQNLLDLKLTSYYKHIGYLTQDPSVFDGTVYQNLSYAVDEHVSKERLDQAIKLAECEFLYKFPHGLHAEVGERGINMSGGQRQRLAIAKILVKNPDIVILDEPTSALDSFSEDDISKVLDEVFKDKTRIVVAHRLQTVMNADQIIVLHRQDGDDAPTQIVEQGTHQELLKQGGIYASMFALQSGQNKKKN